MSLPLPPVLDSRLCSIAVLGARLFSIGGRLMAELLGTEFTLWPKPNLNGDPWLLLGDSSFFSGSVRPGANDYFRTFTIFCSCASFCSYRWALLWLRWISLNLEMSLLRCLNSDLLIVGATAWILLFCSIFYSLIISWSLTIAPLGIRVATCGRRLLSCMLPLIYWRARSSRTMLIFAWLIDPLLKVAMPVLFCTFFGDIEPFAILCSPASMIDYL